VDWTTVGKIIVPLAPALGSILGGLIPVPGGSLAGQLGGQVIGNIIAKKLGVEPNPDAVGAALGAMTDKDVLIAKLNAAAEELRSTNQTYAEVEKAYLDAVTKASQQVNETMREEIKAENRHWFFTGWRPACGWLFVTMGAAFGALLLWATSLAIARSADPLRVISEAWPIYLAYFGTLAAMVGVYVIQRTQEKVSGAAQIKGTVLPPKPLPKR
jgi:hypothetical protein